MSAHRVVVASSLVCSLALAAAPKVVDQPITQLPYSPSLDLANLDRAVDPCTDFYSFSCGGWEKTHPIPADRGGWSVYAKLSDDTMHHLWGLLLEASKPSKDRSPVDTLVGDAFAACMDEKAVEKRGLTPLKADLKAIDALKDVGQLPALLGALHRATSDQGMLFGTGAAQDYGDSSRVVAYVYAGGLGLPDRDYYVKDDAASVALRAKYLAWVERAMVLLGHPKADAARVVALETALARASLTNVERRDPHNLHHLVSLKDLQAMTPLFDWAAYFTAVGLPGATEVNVTEPRFLAEVQARLGDLPTLKAYLAYHLLRTRAEYLGHAWAGPHFEFFSKTLRGVKQPLPRWKQCTRLIDRDLGEALAQAWVKRTFPPELKAATVEMTRRVEQAMEEDLKTLTWMGPETKQAALTKLHAIRNKVGYPDSWRDYTGLEVKRDDFTGNVLRAVAFETKRQLAKVGKPVDRGEWQMTPPTVNAYYDAQLNDINFPAGGLQPPLFDFKMDDAPNYGDTGATIGHELTHGFDDEGRQFDGDGNLRDWWTPADARAFEERAQCVVDQYAQYVVIDDVHINSKLTLGEDVADLGGTVLAYAAWKQATAGKALEPRDGFTPDQRFFIGMAQWVCGAERPESLRLHAATDPHSPGKYRINGVVSNMPEFRAAFACKADAPMVRPKPCRVW